MNWTVYDIFIELQLSAEGVGYVTELEDISWNMFQVTYFYVTKIIFDTNDELTWRIMDWIIFLVSRALVSVSSIDRVWRFIRWWSRVTSRDTSCDTDLTSRVLQVQFSKNDTDLSSNQKYNNKHLRWSDPIWTRNQAKRGCWNILQRTSHDSRPVQDSRIKLRSIWTGRGARE